MKSLTEIKRWAKLRCAHCGHRFRWSRDPRSSFGGRDGKVYHGPCIAYLIWRKSAEDRLTVLGLVAEIADLGDSEVGAIAELRAADENERTASSNRVWRVFNDLRKSAPPAPSVPEVTP